MTAAQRKARERAAPLTEKQEQRYLELNYSMFGAEEGVMQLRTKIVRTRLIHPCAADREQHPIPAGSLVVADTALVDGDSVGTCYVCLPCLNAWGKEIGY